MNFVNCQRRQLGSDLGVVIDSRMTMADHVASVCCSAYCDDTQFITLSGNESILFRWHLTVI